MDIEVPMTTKEGAYTSLVEVKVAYSDDQIVEIINRYFDSRRAQIKNRKKRIAELNKLKAFAKTQGWKP